MCVQNINIPSRESFEFVYREVKIAIVTVRNFQTIIQQNLFNELLQSTLFCSSTRCFVKQRFYSCKILLGISSKKYPHNVLGLCMACTLLKWSVPSYTLGMQRHDVTNSRRQNKTVPSRFNQQICFQQVDHIGCKREVMIRSNTVPNLVSFLH